MENKKKNQKKIISNFVKTKNLTKYQNIFDIWLQVISLIFFVLRAKSDQV